MMRTWMCLWGLASLFLPMGCGSGSTAAAEPESSGNETAPTAEAESDGASCAPLEGAPNGTVAASAPCAAYLTHYQRCETQLSAEIAAGDRRTYAAEEGWVHFMEDSAEAPGMPTACRDMDVELSAVCP